MLSIKGEWTNVTNNIKMMLDEGKTILTKARNTT